MHSTSSLIALIALLIVCFENILNFILVILLDPAMPDSTEAPSTTKNLTTTDIIDDTTAPRPPCKFKLPTSKYIFEAW